MCGLSGQYARDGVIDNARMVQMAVEMQSRGKDSTGYIAKDSSGNIVIKKDILSADEFFEKYPLKKKYHWMFVHTRAASCGEVSVANAHPFVCGDIIGMQNGFCHNHTASALELGLEPRECDSNTLFDMINLLGEPLAFGYSWTGAIIYYDKAKERIEIRASRYELPVSIEANLLAFASTRKCIVNAGFRVNWSERGIEKLTLEG